MGATIDDEIRGHPYRTATLPWAHGAGFVAAKQTELVAVSDTIAEKAEHICTRYNARRSYADYRELIEIEQPDVINIATRVARPQKLQCTPLNRVSRESIAKNRFVAQWRKLTRW